MNYCNAACRDGGCGYLTKFNLEGRVDPGKNILELYYFGH
jgi:hypothetical protein